MKYVGIDLHERSIAVSVIDQERRVLKRTTLFPEEPQRIVEFFSGLGAFQAVMEATGSYDWLWELLRSLAKRLVLAHPGRMRVIAESRRKTDKRDAETLAEFLALGMVPEAHHPTRRERDHRTLLRHDLRLGGRMSSVRCRVRCLLARRNLERADLFTTAGRKYLAEAPLEPQERFVLDELLAELDFLEAARRRATARLREFAEGGPEEEARRRELLRSIPGVGEKVSEAVLAELADPGRFPSAKAMASYAGLVPGMRESGGKERPQGITKEGSRVLRWALVEAAWQGVRRSPHWRRVFEGLSKRRGKRRAIVAVARRLLGTMSAPLRSGRPYEVAGDPPKKARAAGKRRAAAKPAPANAEAAKAAPPKPEAAKPAPPRVEATKAAPTKAKAGAKAAPTKAKAGAKAAPTKAKAGAKAAPTKAETVKTEAAKPKATAKPAPREPRRRRKEGSAVGTG